MKSRPTAGNAHLDSLREALRPKCAKFSGQNETYPRKSERRRRLIAQWIPTAYGVSCGDSVGSSHSRLTSAEDYEEASLLGLPAHRSSGHEEYRTGGTKKERRGLISSPA